MKSSIFIFIAFLTLFFASLNSYASTDKLVNLSVEGMFSNTCPILLKSAVSKIKGVKTVEASLENKSAKIEFDENITSLKNIQETIKTQVGFSTELK